LDSSSALISPSPWSRWPAAPFSYDTSNVLHHYPEDRYVGAALELFASVAMMLWYVLRLFMSRR
jgi:FtsH-binding integral membrane protein